MEGKAKFPRVQEKTSRIRIPLFTDAKVVAQYDTKLLSSMVLAAFGLSISKLAWHYRQVTTNKELSLEERQQVSLPPTFLPYDFQTAIYLINPILTPILQNKSLLGKIFDQSRIILK